ncbi:MAG: NAD(P)H-dependent oxidoreductase [Methanobacteriaceae archaeon]
MKVVGFVGSPKRNGTTDFLVSKILDKAEENGAEIAKYNIHNEKISPCQGCLYCTKHNKCTINDGMQDLYKELLSADAIVIGTPIYFGQATGQTRAFTDRFYAIHQNPDKLFAGKKLIQVYTQLMSDENTYAEYAQHEADMLYGFVGFDVLGRVIAPGLEDGIGSIKEETIKKAEDLANLL